MFYLHASNKTENLLQHLSALLEADPQDSFFNSESIVVQSQGMERMISQAMAEHFSCWCNYTYFLPISFLNSIGELMGINLTSKSFERDVLCWRIEQLFDRLEGGDFTPLLRYLDGDQPAVKRYQLAKNLANIFDQYQLMRGDMLQSWEEGKLVLHESSEKWQRALWLELMEEDLGEHRGVLIHKIAKTLHSLEKDDKLLRLLPKRVSIFGVHTLPPIFIDCLRGLARHIDVHLFLLSPCKNYWGDLRKSNSFGYLADEEGHPLLFSLGKQGRDFQELLLEKVMFDHEITSYENPFDDHNPLLLHRLQRDLLDGIPSPEKWKEEDKSVRIVSCHSITRELNVLKDHILNILDSDSTMQLWDFVVMAPDIQEYAPYVAAIFDNIPHSIADRSILHDNSFIADFLEFVMLVKSRFGWSELLDILGRQNVAKAFNLSQGDLELLREWVVGAGIRWGLSEETRKAEGHSYLSNCWQSGLERLLMGYAIDIEDEVEDVLPHPVVEGVDAQLLGRLCEFVNIIKTYEKESSHPRSLASWSKLLINFSQLLFGESEERDYVILTDIIGSLEKYGVYNAREIEIDVILDWFAHETMESRSSSGFLGGSLTFCSMLPMRSIPFRSVCLLGLNHNSFPKKDQFSTYDLVKLKSRLGDRSLRADDRYQFLEALLSARDSLYLSYIGQSLKNNEKVPPSVVLTEFLDLLGAKYGSPVEVEYHPLHGFSYKYFSSESPLFSFDVGQYEVARNALNPPVEKKRWWTGKIDCDEEIIHLDHILNFYTHPQKFFLRHSLGVHLENEREFPEQSEPFTSRGLEGYLADKRIVETILRKKELDQELKILQENGLMPVGQIGELEFCSKVEEITEFTETVSQLAMGDVITDMEVDVHIGHYRIQGIMPHLHENGILLMRYGRFHGRDLLRGWFLHQLARRSKKVPSTTVIHMKDRTLCFDEETGVEGPELEPLVDVFIDGCSQPSSLLIQPGVEYCKQKMSRRAKVTPLEKARLTCGRILEEGYDPVLSLLYSNPDEMTDDNFVRVIEKILLPIWGGSDGR